jgi:hypothetical protein
VESLGKQTILRRPFWKEGRLLSNDKFAAECQSSDGGGAGFMAEIEVCAAHQAEPGHQEGIKVSEDEL